MGVYEGLTRNKKIKEVESALDYIGTMITTRDDGENYVGMYELLEAELITLRAMDGVKDRIRQRLAHRSMQVAA